MAKEQSQANWSISGISDLSILYYGVLTQFPSQGLPLDHSCVSILFTFVYTAFSKLAVMWLKVVIYYKPMLKFFKSSLLNNFQNL